MAKLQASELQTGPEQCCSHAEESKLQAQAGESSGAESVIFKEHFGGQEAREEQRGREQPPKHFILTTSLLLVLQPEPPSKFPTAVNRGCVMGRQMARAAADQVLPTTSLSPPPSASLHPLPPLVTGSGVTVWEIGRAHV